MKTFFTEFPANYDSYSFPYQVWALQENALEGAQLLGQGFLPTRLKLNLWYLARSSRVNLANFRETSENRRVIKQTSTVRFTVVPAETFTLTPTILELIREYITTHISTEFSDSAIKRIFSKHTTQQILTYYQDEKMVGLSPLLTTKNCAFYWYGFYHPDFYKTSLGVRAMYEAVSWANQQNMRYIYLGTVYSNSSLYKTNFEGFEFFNGGGWSSNLSELKYLISKDEKSSFENLLHDAVYQENFFATENLTQFLKRYVS